jgi:hypothetical protein
MVWCSFCAIIILTVTVNVILFVFCGSIIFTDVRHTHSDRLRGIEASRFFIYLSLISSCCCGARESNALLRLRVCPAHTVVLANKNLHG